MLGFNGCGELITVTLKFKPEIEAGLLVQAQASGMSVQE
jgi:hypothetical protein